MQCKQTQKNVLIIMNELKKNNLKKKTKNKL